MKGTVFTAMIIVFCLIVMGFFFIILNEKIIPAFDNSSNITIENFKSTGVNDSLATTMLEDQEDFKNALLTIPYVMIFMALLAIIIIALINKARAANEEGLQ